jgi:hypothetical protein
VKLLPDDAIGRPALAAPSAAHRDLLSTRLECRVGVGVAVVVLTDRSRLN